jgi:hypothetical protein
MSLGAVLTLILITDAMPMHWNCGYVQTTDGREGGAEDDNTGNKRIDRWFYRMEVI